MVSVATPIEAAPSVGAVAAPATRIASVDILRGIVMVVMALDHVRDYFTNVRFAPEDLTQTNAALFLTRWITHFCAPTFVFLAGTGAFLSLGRGRDVKALSRFLWTRGLWLVVLEFTFVRSAWLFSVSPAAGFWVQVIWALGISMIVLAALVRLPLPWIAAFGIVMIAGHNLLDGVAVSPTTPLGWLWSVLHVQGPLIYEGQPVLFVAYPVVPWIGVMAAGYAFGALLQRPEAERRRTLLRLGGAMTAAFVLIRLVNVYGDPQPWSVQKDAVTTVLSFLNTTKYPPSLDYLLMTLGPAIMSLVAFERWTGPVARFFSVFGRVPLFYYLAHVALAHLLAGLTALAMGFGSDVLTGNVFFSPTQGWGFGLGVVYLVWFVVILLLYLPCRWYADLKARRRDLVLLSYL
ncbi:MAG TPA: heparan-alpha-glucosaminide N-acetyltransferase domain-containing protein [Gemmatimonadales bacterium]|nr:heparan-alpha-glucosaminide N-acetyltransferase domain-containing protein [Gemmatimonadales bacterium]